MPTKLDMDYFIDNVVEGEKKEIKEVVTPAVVRRMMRYAHELEVKYFKTVADYMNFFSPPHKLLGDGDPFEGVEWDMLKKKTIRAKDKYYKKFGTPDGYIKSSNKWFFKGELQKFLRRQNVGSYFGESSIEESDGVIRYHSNLENDRRPFGEKQEYKVTGTLKTGLSNEDARPIFEPIREFYLNVRLPKELDKAADHAIGWTLYRKPRWRNIR